MPRRRPLRTHVLTFALIFVQLLVVGLRPARAVDDATLREQVLTAITRAQQFLSGRQMPDGSWEPTALGQYKAGVTSLAVLSLLYSGMDRNDPVVRAGLDHLRSLPDPVKTYELAMFCMVLAAANDNRDVGRLHKLATRLESYQRPNGAWGYDANGNWWDNSNTQFALLGLREAAHAGVPVSRRVWQRAQEHWLRQQIGSSQLKSGAGWGYKGGGEGSPTGSMTVAGISSLTITSSFLGLDPPDGQLDCCGEDRSTADEAIEAGIRWIGNRFSISNNPGNNGWLLYYLYGLERAGRLSGRRFFGDHDWYREGADFLVKRQSVRNGSWASEGGGEADPLVATSFALLFLSKGLSPVLINKLNYGPGDPITGEPLSDDWNNHPHDIQNLTQHISGRDRWPKLLNWQEVDLRKAAETEGVGALLQAPVLFMSGTESPDSIQGTQLELLREYLAQGGFLFAVQNCDNTEFDTGFRNLIRRLFPDGSMQLRRLPDTHDVYRNEFVFSVEPPELWGVDFGCRTAVMYAPYDHACRWEHWLRHDPPNREPGLRAEIGKSMQLGVNVVAYATGREVHDRLERPAALAELEDNLPDRGHLGIARLRHTGGWDTAPHALRHLQIALLQKNGIPTSAETPTLVATDPALFDYPLLYMHGRQNFSLSDVEQEKLREYLENGGVLFADACCGAAQFDASFRDLIQEIFGQKLERIPIDHELFDIELGYNVKRVRRRLPTTSADSGALGFEESWAEPVLEGIKINDRYVVIYSKYDLSCALERQATSACSGYPTEDATRIAANIILYALLQ